MLLYRFINGRKYYYAGIYDTYQAALNMGKHKKKTGRSRYQIFKTENGQKYVLYLTKYMRGW